MNEIIIALFINVLGEVALGYKAVKEIAYRVKGSGKYDEVNVPMIIGDYQIMTSIRYYDDIERMENESKIVTEDVVMFISEHNIRFKIDKKSMYDLGNYWKKLLTITDSIELPQYKVSIKKVDEHLLLICDNKLLLKGKIHDE